MKKILTLLCLAITTLLVAACSQPQPAPPEAAAAASDFDPNSLIVSVQDVQKAIHNDDERLIVIGVINPTAALVPFTTPWRAIENAHLVWRPDYSSGGTDVAISPSVTGMRRPVSEMEELLSRAGVTADSRIVVYAADAMHDAARLVWQLRMLGHESSWYIDGGMNAWVAANFSTGRAVRMADQPVQSEFRVSNYNPDAFNKNIDDVIHALENPDEWVVIDTRSRAEYDGERTGSSSGAFGTGRLAGAVFIDWNAAVDPETQQLRSREELEEIYLEAIGGRNVITYCQSGVRSAHTWLVLREVLGIENVWNYEGSWIEWSYAASEYSDYPSQRILELTELWNDNRGAI